MWPGNRRLLFYILSAQYNTFIYLFIYLCVVWLTTFKETPKSALETILKGAVVA